MTRREWWEGVVAKVESAFDRNELFCEMKTDSYRVHFADKGNIWDVRWHIERSTRQMTNHYIFVNGEMHILNAPDLVGRLEHVGGQLATMKKMMSNL